MCSSTSQEDTLTRDLTAFMEEQDIPSGSVGIMHYGKLIYARDIKRIGEEQSLVEQTVEEFPMYQISHLITSLAILSLSDDDLVDINRNVFVKEGPLSGFLEAIPGDVDKRIEQITIMNLLQQTAGWEHREDFQKSGVLLPSDVLQTMLSRKLHSTPGTKFKSSIFNEFLLRMIIEDVSEISYEEYVKHKILIPFGMWKTKLHRRTVEAGGLYTTNLMPTTWMMTVQDVFRLMTAISDQVPNPILRKDTLKLIFSRPAPPFKQHSESWHGMGLRVKNDGSFWTEYSESGHYLLLHSSGSNISRGPAGQIENSIPKTVFLTHFNTKKPSLFKHLFLDYIQNIDHWTDTDNIFGMDLFSSTYNSKAVTFRIHEQHFSAFMEALRAAKYEPTWINAYTEDEHTFFVVISKKVTTKSEKNKNWLVQHGMNKNKLETYLSHKEDKGFQVELIQNYLCHSHEDKKCYFVILRQPQNETKDIILVNEKYTSYLKKVPDYHRDGYVATVQSILTVKEHNEVSAILNRNSKKTYKPFIDLTIDDFERVIYEEALDEFNLCYLDTYFNEKDLQFSAIFKKGKAERWILQQDLKLANLAREVEQLKQTKLFPKMIVGYVNKDKNFFSVFYT